MYKYSILLIYIFILFDLYQYFTGCVPLTDMQTPPPLRSGVNFMKGADCGEENGKNNINIHRFLFFELSSKIGVIFEK